MKDISIEDCLNEYGIHHDNLEYHCTGVKVRNKIIHISTDSSRDEIKIILGEWENVTFVIKDNSKLEFNNSTFRNVTFAGDSVSSAGETESHLIFTTCIGRDISICGFWSLISFKNHVVFTKLVLEGIIKSCVFCDTVVENISDKAMYHHYTAKKTMYKNGKWIPDIRQSLELTNDVQFNNTIIDIDPIFQYCNADVRKVFNFAKAHILPDKWSKLRDTYTGLQLTLVLFLTTVFGFPYIFKVFFYLFSNKFVPETLKDSIPNIPLWQILLLNDKPISDGWYYSVPAILLIIYNIARLYLTLSVNRMREREEHLHMYGFELYKPNVNSRKFKIDWKIHYVLFRLQILAICLAIYRFVEVLLKDVPVFFNLK